MREKSKDHAYAVAKAITSSVPIAGGALSTIFESLVANPVEVRKQAWREQVTLVLAELVEKTRSFDPDQLRNNQVFITTVLEATQQAIRTHFEEKHSALLSLIASAAEADADETRLSMYLNILEQLTPLHLQILDFVYRFRDHRTAHEQRISASELSLIHISEPTRPY